MGVKFMKKIEELLREGKMKFDEIEVPEELEERLRNSLNKCSSVRVKRKKWIKRIAAACLVVFLIGYNLDTLAFYGKRLIGYEPLMNGNLKQLNELGKGQAIGKSHTFKNGVTVTLDGIMLDENQILVFYTIKDPKGKADAVHFRAPMRMKGLFGTYDMESGQGEINEENTEIKWLASFKSPFFLEQKLRFQFELMEENVEEKGEIVFKLDRNKAMRHTLKKTINQSVKFGGRNIRFKSILASPTCTVIKGSIQNTIELVKDHLKGERLRFNHLDIKLIANGKELLSQGMGMRTDQKGITFHHEFDPLPENLQSLQIKVESFSADYDVNQKIHLQKDQEAQSVKVLDQNIIINKVVESNGATDITITTKEGTVLTRVYLFIDGNKVELERTDGDSREKLADGSILHTRTLHFPGTGKTYQLYIERMTSITSFNKRIDIPLH